MINYSRLSVADFAAVDELMKLHRQTLGFLPAGALKFHLGRGGVFGAKIGTSLVGYLLYTSSSTRFRITHLCVSDEFSGRGIAKQLLETLKSSAITQKSVELNCRRDFPAHRMWPKLGFIPIDEKPGRSMAGHLLTHWYLPLHLEQQPELALFKAKTSDETLDVVVDAQVFFHFFEPDSASTVPSKALLADSWVDALNIWVTDELLVEINRNNDHQVRQRNRSRTGRFPQISPSSELVEDYIGLLKGTLPSTNESQESDIRHLAKTAASDVDVFVTSDQALLRKQTEISNLTNLQLLSPTELIIQMHQLSEAHSYGPNRVAGLRLGWHRFSQEDFQSFPHEAFLNQGERKGKFRETLGRYLARPDIYTCELLKQSNDIASIRAISREPLNAIKLPLARVASSVDGRLYGNFLIADTLAKAVDNSQSLVELKESAITPGLVSGLLEMGFTRRADGFVRFCFSSCLTRREVIEQVSELSPVSREAFEKMPNYELERRCSPLSLHAEQNYFLIPIRPSFALGLFDRQRSANTLFGVDTTVLLRWRNVYYRRKTFHNMLKPPARILWYVSEQKEVIAVSHLDAVDIDVPKELFKRFKRFGVLQWENLYKMCKQDISTPLMALQFSHTFLFRKRVTLKNLREVCSNHGMGLSLRGPSRVSRKTFEEVFQLGYPSPKASNETTDPIT